MNCKQKNSHSVSDTECYLAAWERFAGELKESLPQVVVEDNGETILYGALSPGCQHCKEGHWDCLFVTSECNLQCAFCISPRRMQIAGLTSAFGTHGKTIINHYRKTGIRGISFSGGEPFIKFEAFASALGQLHRHFAQNYFWVYTNGLLVGEEQIDTLARLGLDELRFNLAATGYSDSTVLRKAAYAARRLSAVTVEIPALPGERSRLLAALPAWTDCGVKYLNLHELMKERGSPSEALEGDFLALTLPDGHQTNICLESRALMREVLETVHAQKLPLGVNLCSLANKLRQLRGRRRNIGLLVRKEYEQATGNGEYLETIVACKDGKEGFFLHPAEFRQAGEVSPEYEYYRLTRRAPLSLHEHTEYFRKEKAENGAAGNGESG